MSIRITTLSENTASEEGIVAEWGLSVFVEAASQKILFDTGLGFLTAYSAPILGI
jgi:metal-dependent hydrolase (beta-lactamase superfamily II)